MAENSKNRDRFNKIYKVRTLASTSVVDFPGITGLGPSAVVDVSENPLVTWTLQVTGVGGTPTIWEVVLEGSTDGVTFSEILKHTPLVGDGKAIFSGTTLFLASYYRINTTVLTLGPATSITVNVIGKQ